MFYYHLFIYLIKWIFFLIDLFGGTSSLSARPKSTLGRRIIEKEENSLPPLRSPRPPQQKDTNSDFDKTSLDGRLPNGVIFNLI